MELKNNTILITGGSSGFGLEFTARLLEMGNTIIITGRDANKLAQTKAQYPQIHTFQSDASSPDAIQELYKLVTTQFPDLNMLINNAGIMRIIDLQDKSIDMQDLVKEININLLGPIWMIRQFLPHLLSKKNAAILNVTSGLAMVPLPVSPIYSAAKAGLRAYTKALRVQLKDTAIKVFELTAPAAKTPLSADFGMKDNQLMDPKKLIANALTALQQDQLEIYPGFAKVMRILSRLAPNFLLKQMSKV